MGYSSTERRNIRTTTLYSILTCVTIPPILAILYYTNQLYTVGQYQSYWIILSFITLEFLKLSILFAYKDDRAVQKRPKSKPKEVFKFVSLMGFMTLAYFLMAIFFGASLISKYEETLMLAILLATLTVLASCVHVGVDMTKSLIMGLQNVDDVFVGMVQLNMQCTIFGAWLGAVVIPLDWHRPWQEWPIPCWLGAVFGYVVAHILTLLKLIPFVSRLFSLRKKLF